ncbi:TPA: DUF2591 domain-containing protein [Enterobacter asburiae]|nr:DUF2591 domain-containing protein [Enterobacter asburiae]HCR2018666.1 DUF2591 domain-containing protein [Enterobacter asburiae]HCR2025515.1 DUF2591 domain-containing protein [Enterobacter asburiae]HCR2035183.1 DUF2591 domain-containing protein [Enterobacter asburiae]HCR2039327.1 DUF2591 domain-containing protein [Enterobacter asburiae]
MDYSQLSDFEINKLVAYALGNADVGRPFDEISGTACRFTVFKNSGLNREGEIVMRPMIVTKDFCNNPADAWPIIEGNRISIRNRYEGDWKAENEWGESRFHVSCNPLRAAMIVFLMMQDAKHA